MENFFTAIGAIATVVCVALIIPFVSFWISYFGGWLCSLVIGDTLANALNTLFNTTHFTKDIIPICAGALGWVGGYFQSSNIKFNKD